MNASIRRLLFLGGALTGGAAIAGLTAIASWNRRTTEMAERLDALSVTPEPQTFATAELAGLPDPVARYFAFALTPGQPMIRVARIEHEGEMRTSLDQPWGPFRSVQHFAATRPGFVWDARFRMGGFLPVRIRDGYAAGEGSMLGKVGGVVTVVSAQGTPSIAAGALHRQFMERAWLPTALLPSQGVRWEPIDDRSARAYLSEDGIDLSIDVFFGDAGEIVRVEAVRMRDVDGVGVPTPFVGHFGDYQRTEGMMIPMRGEVTWVLPAGPFTYWRGRVSKASYEYGR
jgi:hypothetical protein